MVQLFHIQQPVHPSPHSSFLTERVGCTNSFLTERVGCTYWVHCLTTEHISSSKPLTCPHFPFLFLHFSKKHTERGMSNGRHATLIPLLDEEIPQNFCNSHNGNNGDNGGRHGDSSSITIVLIFSVAVVFCGSFTFGCSVSIRIFSSKLIVL